MFSGIQRMQLFCYPCRPQKLTYREKMRVLFWIVRNRKNQYGLCPISCRITINGKRREIYTGIYIKPSDFKYGRVKGNSKIVESYNHNMYELRNNLFLVYYEILRRKNSISAKEVKETFLRSTNNKNLKDLFNEYVEAAKSYTSTSTHIVLRQRQKAFIKCLEHLELDNIQPIDLTHDLLHEIKKTLLHKLEYAPSYTRGIITSITKALEWAFNHGKIESNPVHGFRTRLQSHKKLTYLTQEEQEKLKKIKLPKKFSNIRDFFLVQCQTGLSYIDVLRVKEKHIHKDEKGCLWILINRQKVANAECQIPITKQVYKLFEKHQWNFCLGSYNTVMRSLVKIGELASIDKKLTTHLGRKTFASTLLNKDVPMETVSKLLGHKSVKTTEKYYAEILQMKIARDVRKVLSKTEAT